MKFRVFAQSDEAAVIRLWTRCELVHPSNDPSEDIRRKLAFQPELFFVGLLGEKIITSVMAGYEGHRGWINYLAVDPEHQRKGVGRAIMLYAEKELEGIGAEKINLQVRSENTAVVHFYNRLGYDVEARASLGKRLKKDPSSTLDNPALSSSIED